MVPITNPPPNSPQALYNRRQIKCRNIVERCIGLLKSRFRCLLQHRYLHYHPRVAGKIVNACAILHNLCIDARLELELADGEELVAGGPEGMVHEAHIDDPGVLPGAQRDHWLRQGRHIQQQIVNQYFVP